MLRRFLGAALTALLALAVAAGAVITALGFLDGRAFPGELMALFRVQYFAAALALGAVSALAQRRRIAFVAVGLAALNGLGLVPGLAGDARPDPAQPQLRLLVANVWYPGNDYSALTDLVERERPDVVALTELTRDWAAGISPGLAEYPHRVLQAQAGAYGVGLYSREPLVKGVVVYPAESWPPVVRATVRVGDGRVELFVLHAPSAIRRLAAARHREFMRNLGTLAGDAGDTALVCGDFNAAPWSGPYRDLLQRGGLERDDPWLPFEWTYPVWNRLLRVPIDQCLAGPAVEVSSRTGPSIGSDHFPLLVEIGL
jgi:endonuclease/exonuclease/phosphatase (EEP) superfamily protein YafD